MIVTFHKGFAEACGLPGVLEELIELGVERILTSGVSRTAPEGLARLVELSREGAGKIIVMPGGRITEADLPTLSEAGLREIHVGTAACAEGKTGVERIRWIVNEARSHSPSVGLGGSPG